MRGGRSGAVTAGLAVLALGLPSCGLFGGSSDDPIVIGAVTFAENQIVAEMYALVLESGGYEVERRFNFPRREELYPELADGRVDLAPEYLASLRTFLEPDAEASSDANENLKRLEGPLSADGLTLLEPSPANDTNAIVVTQATAETLGLETVSDLRGHAPDLIFGGPPECPERPFCLQGLRDEYGIEFGEFKAFDAGGPLTIAALQAGEVDVALLFSTSGVIAARDWVALEDDRMLQAADNITPLVRSAVVDERIAELLNSVGAELTTEDMTTLNALVEVENEQVGEVAANYLTRVGLLSESG